MLMMTTRDAARMVAPWVLVVALLGNTAPSLRTCVRSAPDHVLDQRSEQLPDLVDRWLEPVPGLVLRLPMLHGEGDQRHGDDSSDRVIAEGNLKTVA